MPKPDNQNQEEKAMPGKKKLPPLPPEGAFSTWNSGWGKNTRYHGGELRNDPKL